MGPEACLDRLTIDNQHFQLLLNAQLAQLNEVVLISCCGALISCCGALISCCGVPKTFWNNSDFNLHQPDEDTLVGSQLDRRLVTDF